MRQVPPPVPRRRAPSISSATMSNPPNKQRIPPPVPQRRAPPTVPQRHDSQRPKKLESDSASAENQAERKRPPSVPPRQESTSSGIDKSSERAPTSSKREPSQNHQSSDDNNAQPQRPNRPISVQQHRKRLNSIAANRRFSRLSMNRRVSSLLFTRLSGAHHQISKSLLL